MAASALADGADPGGSAVAPCWSCGKAAPIYTCPRCGWKSCSLPCVRAHKVQTDCSGKRDRTGFVPRGKLDERSLLSDLRFLEEARAAEEAARRTVSGAWHPGAGGAPSGGAPSAGAPSVGVWSPDLRADAHLGGPDWTPGDEGSPAAGAGAARLPPPDATSALPRHLQKLLEAARVRGVDLRVAPAGLSRRRANTTQLERGGDALRWRVEWRLGGERGRAVASPRVPESARLGDALGAALEADAAKGAERRAELPERYRRARAKDLAIAVRVDPAAAAPGGGVAAGGPPRYDLLDPSLALAEALRGRVVREFPTFLACLPEDARALGLDVADAVADAAATEAPEAPLGRGAGEEEDAPAGDVGAATDEGVAGSVEAAEWEAAGRLDGDEGTMVKERTPPATEATRERTSSVGISPAGTPGAS